VGCGPVHRARHRVQFLAVGQPAISKHPKVMRQAGFRSLDDWLAPYRGLWPAHLDALAIHLDNTVQRNRRE
jgi:hypothetical protein